MPRRSFYTDSSCNYCTVCVCVEAQTLISNLGSIGRINPSHEHMHEHIWPYFVFVLLSLCLWSIVKCIFFTKTKTLWTYIHFCSAQSKLTCIFIHSHLSIDLVYKAMDLKFTFCLVWKHPECFCYMSTIWYNSFHSIYNQHISHLRQSGLHIHKHW